LLTSSRTTSSPTLSGTNAALVVPSFSRAKGSGKLPGSKAKPPEATRPSAPTPPPGRRMLPASGGSGLSKIFRALIELAMT